MRARGAVLAAVVLLGLLVGVQVVATDVGAEIGVHWSDPVAVSTITVEDGLGVADLDAADGDPGAIAWLQRSDTTRLLRYARIRTTGPVGEPETLRRRTADLDDVTVATDGDRLAIAWKNVTNGSVHLAVRGENATRYVSFSEGRLVDEPAVAWLEDVPTLTWRARRNGSWGIEIAAVDSEGVTRRRFATATTGEGSPTLAAAGGRAALAIVDRSSRARVRHVSLVDGGVAATPWTDLGPARPRSTTLGATGGSEMDAAHNGSAVDALWTDVRTIHARAVSPNGTSGTRQRIGNGRAPAIATNETARLIAWLVSSRTGSLDVVAMYRGPAGTTSGVASGLPSTATFAEPLFAPDPALAWTERGGDRSRLLFSRYTPDGERAALDRLTRTPKQFAAIAVGAAVLGLFTVPMMPWTLLALVAAFIVTTRLVERRLASVGVWLASLRGRTVDRRSVQAWLHGGPRWLRVLAFGAVQIGIATALVATEETVTSIGFTAPVVVGVGAALATLLVLRLGPVKTTWRGVAGMAVTYNAGMWATALPAFL